MKLYEQLHNKQLQKVLSLKIIELNGLNELNELNELNGLNGLNELNELNINKIYLGQSTPNQIGLRYKENYLLATLIFNDLVSTPPLFLASQDSRPLSLLFTSVITRCVLLLSRRNRSLYFSIPFPLNVHLISGSGFPIALQ